MQEILTLAQSPEAWIALITLIVMEVVLGIDNLIFISILTNKLPPENRVSARRIGIGLALIMRLALLGTIAWIVQLTQPVFEAFGHGFSWKDMILIAGGLFLVWKATKEIHHSVDPSDHEEDFIASSAINSFAAAIGQILLLDLVFSVDSIITAVGMTPHLPIMVVAVVVAVTVMLVRSQPACEFHREKSDDRHAGPGLPPDDRHDPYRRRHGLPRAEGLRLCGHGLLRTGRGSQHGRP